tara:strand:+ start:219 stop:572 length:354 start_codon:yes stop_codon:yes gene_type:complete
MKAYNIDNASPRERQKDPLSGGYLMPGNCVDVKPPDFDSKTHTCKFDGSKWVTTKIPDPPKEPKEKEPEPYVETYKDKRLKEYGSAQEQIEFITENGLEAWQIKVASIKEKYPKPSE